MRVMNPMNFKQTALERAFEIARQGRLESIEDIRRQLQREGFNQFQIAGPVLIRQLIDIVRKARAVADEIDGRTGHRSSRTRRATAPKG